MSHAGDGPDAQDAANFGDGTVPDNGYIPDDLNIDDFDNSDINMDPIPQTVTIVPRSYVSRSIFRTCPSFFHLRL